MNIGIIKEAMQEADTCECKFTEPEKNFIAYYAYKMEDMTQVKFLLAELIEAREGEREVVYRKHSKILHIQSGMEYQVERMMVLVERYRIEQEQIISQLSDILKANGIEIPLEEIRQAEIQEMKERVKKEIRR